MYSLRQLRAKIKRQHIVIAAFLSVILIGGVAIVAPHRDVSQPNPEPELVTTSTDAPNEHKPDPETYRWQGKPHDPKYLAIPGVAEGFVQKAGVDQHKAIAVPSNIHMAGWYTESVLPGKKGLSIIDGHVDGRKKSGIFANLAKVKQGTEFTVTFGNNDTASFRVKRVVTVETREAEATLFSQDPSISRQLNLITCGGKYDRSARTYDKRVIVVSEKID